MVPTVQGTEPDRALPSQSTDPQPGRSRTLAGAILAPTLFLLLWFAPLGLQAPAHRLAAIFAAVIVMWVTEVVPISVTALLIAPAMVVTGVTDAKSAFAPYADPLLFLFVGGFMIARSMTRHGLDRRLALSMVSMPGVRGAPARVRLAFMATGLVLSMWISNTATTAILLPILIGLLDRAQGPTHDDASGTGGILAVAYGSSIGGLGTPVGSPPNLIAMGFLRDAGYELSFFDWVKIGLPTAVLMLLATFLLFQRRFPPVASGVDHEPIAPAWSRGEKVTLLSFGLAVLGWMLPGILKALSVPGAGEISKALPGGAVAILAASVLFFFRDPQRRSRVLPWSDAARIDWGIIMLFGGGISMGRQMFDTGLAEALSKLFVETTGVSELWTFTALVAVFTIFFTETCSNTATSNMLSPLVIAVASELGVSPFPPVLAVGLAASCAFMLPIATGPNAIAYGTGRVEQSTMIRTGFWLNLVAVVVILILLRLLCPLYGWI